MPSNILINIGIGGAAAAASAMHAVASKVWNLRKSIIALTESSDRYWEIMDRTTHDMRAFNAQTAGLIDTMASLQTANSLAEAGIKLTDQQMANLGKRAIDFAQKTGRDATETFERMAQAITKGSSRALIQFGVVLEDSTDKTKTQAQAVEALTAGLDDMEIKTVGMKDQLYGFQNTIGTLKDQLTAPALYNFIDWIGGVESGFGGVSFAVNVLSDDLTAGGQSFARWATSAEGALNLVTGMWAEITGNTEKGTRAAEQYYRELQKGRTQEQQRRADRAAEQEAQLAARQVLVAGMASPEAPSARRGGGGGGDAAAKAAERAEQERAKAAAAMQAEIDDFRQRDIDNRIAMGLAFIEAEQAQQEAAWEWEQHERRAQIEFRLAEEQAMYDQLGHFQREYYDDNKKWMEADAAYRTQTMMQGVSTIGSFFGQAASLTDTESKKGFEANKNLQMAQVAINTPSAAMGAFQAMAPIPFVGPALGIAAATAATAFGVAQMSKIKRQKYKGGASMDSSSGGPSAPRVPTSNQYGHGADSGADTTIINNVVIDGTVIHSSMIRANAAASQRGETAFATRS